MVNGKKLIILIIAVLLTIAVLAYSQSRSSKKTKDLYTVFQFDKIRGKSDSKDDGLRKLTDLTIGLNRLNKEGFIPVSFVASGGGQQLIVVCVEK
jgi:hypothetical protein